MKIAIIGASGFVGTHLVDEAIQRGLEVTAISRNIDKIKQKEVQKVAIDVNDVDKLATVLEGHEVVLSAYNSGWTNPNIYDDFMKGSRNVQDAVKKAGIKRYIVVGGAGSLYVDENTQVIDTPDFPDEFKLGASAARDYLNELDHEVVLSAYNSGWTNPNIYDDFMKGSRNVQDAVKKAGIKRYIVVGGAGSLYVDENTQVIDTPDFPDEFKLGASAARDYLNE